MSNVQQKPVLDVFGNIRLHATEGLDMPVTRVSEAGTPVDISAMTYVFAIEGIGEFPLVPGGDVYEQRIQVSTVQMASMIIGMKYKYSLIDRTGVVPISMLDGTMKLEGFRAV